MDSKKLKDPWGQIMFLLEQHKVDHVLDVGANIGQYAQKLINENYLGKITSFEPLESAHRELKKLSADYPKWTIMPLMALGDVCEKSQIHISPHSDMSSLLEMSEATKTHMESTHFSGQQAIEVKTLDSIFSQIFEDGEKVYLKLDTQGYEFKVLQGAERSLENICGIQLEMSLLPMYEGEKIYSEIIPYLERRGFRLTTLKPGYFCKHQRQLLQVDGIFFRDL